MRRASFASALSAPSVGPELQRLSAFLVINFSPFPERLARHSPDLCKVLVTCSALQKSFDRLFPRFGRRLRSCLSFKRISALRLARSARSLISSCFDPPIHCRLCDSLCPAKLFLGSSKSLKALNQTLDLGVRKPAASTR